MKKNKIFVAAIIIGLVCALCLIPTSSAKEKIHRERCNLWLYENKNGTYNIAYRSTYFIGFASNLNFSDMEDALADKIADGKRDNIRYNLTSEWIEKYGVTFYAGEYDPR